MNVILILAGIVLIVGGWLMGLVNAGWNTADGKAGSRPIVAMVIGLIAVVAGIVRSF